MEQVTLFKTSDGKTFPDEAAARAWQAGLENAEEINQFLADAGSRLNPRTHTRIRNVIQDFLGWQASREDDEG